MRTRTTVRCRQKHFPGHLGRKTGRRSLHHRHGPARSVPGSYCHARPAKLPQERADTAALWFSTVPCHELVVVLSWCCHR